MNSDHHDPSKNSPLGKSTAYRSDYAPELLFPIPRRIKRHEIGIADTRLPFLGEDIWNAYELSWLNPKGKPVVAVGCFRVPANTPCLIESKSLKLYLNSFNQTRFDNKQTVIETIARDLSDAAGGAVAVDLQLLSDQPKAAIGVPEGILVDDLDIDCDCYQPAPENLMVNEGEIIEETLYSHLLKSNCLVTGQPDWAMVVIQYRGRPIDHAGLLRYIVSFRDHNEFHEQCVERIFCDIRQYCAPEALSVYARYTRRGGLDINPFRSTGDYGRPENIREIRQ
jgi:7-cyano-7-deazaguanine reductase